MAPLPHPASVMPAFCTLSPRKIVRIGGALAGLGGWPAAGETCRKQAPPAAARPTAAVSASAERPARPKRRNLDLISLLLKIDPTQDIRGRESQRKHYENVRRCNGRPSAPIPMRHPNSGGEDGTHAKDAGKRRLPALRP